jgi:hypothetical protein
MDDEQQVALAHDLPVLEMGLCADKRRASRRHEIEVEANRNRFWNVRSRDR